MKIVIANTEEYYLPLTSKMPGESAQLWGEGARELAGTGYFWGGGEKLVVMPSPLDPLVTDELSKRLGYGRVQMLYPKTPSASLCNWLSNGREAGEGPLFAKGEKIEVLLWGQTAEYHTLMDRWREEGGSISGFYGERDTLWTVGLADSKAGFRHLASGLTGEEGLCLPEGWIAGNMAEAAFLAEALLRKGEDVLIKPDRSAGGVGIVAFHSARRPKTGVLKHLRLGARSNPELSLCPLVVERHLTEANSVELYSSVQYRTDGLGGSSLLFDANHLVLEEGVGGDEKLCGALLGKGNFPRTDPSPMHLIAARVSGKVSALGFKGILGVDFLNDRETGYRGLEINARRTSISGAAEVGHHLGGTGWRRKLSVLFIEKTGPVRNWRTLSGKVRDLLYPRGGKAEGWLPSPVPGGAGKEPGWRGALIIGSTPERTLALGGELIRAL